MNTNRSSPSLARIGAVAAGAPVRVIFLRMPVSEEIGRFCWSETEGLKDASVEITGCQVRVARASPSHLERKRFLVRVEVATPDREMVAERLSPEQGENEELEQAIHLAFDAVRCLLPRARPRQGAHLEHEPERIDRGRRRRDRAWLALHQVLDEDRSLRLAPGRARETPRSLRPPLADSTSSWVDPGTVRYLPSHPGPRRRRQGRRGPSPRPVGSQGGSQ